MSEPEYEPTAEDVAIAKEYLAGDSTITLMNRHHRGFKHIKTVLLAQGVEMRLPYHVRGSSPRAPYVFRDGFVRCKGCSAILERCSPEERAYERDGYCGRCTLRKDVMEGRKRGQPARPGWKVCSRCHESKPFSEFHKQSTCAGGLRNPCKVCMKLAAIARRQELKREEEECTS